jgi:hypothetical protein
MVGAYTLDNDVWLWHKIIQDHENNEQLGIEVLTINPDDSMLFGISKTFSD